MDLETSRRKVAALTAPRNAVLVGASDRPGSWSARVWRNLTRYEFPGPIYLVNPRRTELWDRPCYPDFKSLPEPPDHLVVLALAGAVGFVGNSLAARIRTRAGQRLESPALIADGHHARADAYVSLSVVASAGVVAIGLPVVDALIGLAITGVILRITWQSWRTVRAPHPQ